MSGKPINQQQVKFYMSYRKQSNQTQLTAATKAGFSERTARRIDKGEHQTKHQPRKYKTRKDPLKGLFESLLVPLLEQNPALQPITLLEVLQSHSANTFDDSNLRTLQRRVKRWRAKYGPDKDVIFRQRHSPGDMGISDYTWMNKLNITLAGETFAHKVYHYRLVYSGWTYIQVILGGESFESLSSGLQNAFWRSGGVPTSHRTDSLSAAYKNNTEKTLLTERYEKLCKHYHVVPTRNNKGVAHENGAIESPNGHFKRKVEQQLLLRTHRDFTDLAEYEAFLEGIVRTINKRCVTRFNEEKVYLQDLPKQRTNDFSECYVKVTTSSTISIKRVLYTVPSRLIGSALLVHIYDGKLDLFYGHEKTLTLTRIYAPKQSRSRSVDYRHVIHALAKKPNAFKSSVIRDDLIPQGDFTLLWQQLTQEGVTDEDCRYMVNLLVLADNYDCERALGRYVLGALVSGKKVSIQTCRERFGSNESEIPSIVCQQHPINSYDSLMEAH